MPPPPGPQLDQSDSTSDSSEGEQSGTVEQLSTADSDEEIETEGGDEESEGQDTVASWEGLPAGDYLDPDENGTIWFRANDGDNWYQNADESWTKWKD